MNNLSFIEPVGMIDWLTLRLDASFLPPNVQQILKKNTARILKIDKDGALEWESSARESISSDSHQIVIQFGSTLQIMGSPARVNTGNNVFGSLDIQKCAFDMIYFVQKHFCVIFPVELKQWSCTRIDITTNYDLGSLVSVLEAIDALKVVKVGRQKVSPYDSGVVWGKGSNLHNGKAYAKGPDLVRNVKRKKAFCSEVELEKSDRLLRLEYSARRHLIQRIKNDSGLSWYQYTSLYLIGLHTHYFEQFISDIEVIDMENVSKTLLSNVGEGEYNIPTVRQASAAYDCYLRCKNLGRHNAKNTYSSSRTWFRHLKNLKISGIKAIDLQSSNVIPLKKRQIILENPVSCWDDIKLVEGM